jgi:hypothetical protein
MIQELRDCKPFKKGAMYGKWLGHDLYVVYSYGIHWPLAAWHPANGWFVNTDRNSRTTARHSNQTVSSLLGASTSVVSARELGIIISDLSQPVSLAPDHVSRKQQDFFAVSA